MEDKIREWWRRFSREYGINTRYVRAETIIEEYYECHPKEVRPDEKSA
jgi:hypothetical protein